MLILKKSIYKPLATVVFLLALSFIIKTYFISISSIAGESMLPQFKPGELAVVAHFSKNYAPGDVIVFKSPAGKSENIVKRVIAPPQSRVAINDFNVELGGVSLKSENVSNQNSENVVQKIEYIQNNSYLVLWDKLAFECRYSSEFTTDENEYFVLGDNRCKSADSRVIGKVHKKNIIGKVLFKIPLIRLPNRT